MHTRPVPSRPALPLGLTGPPGLVDLTGPLGLVDLTGPLGLVGLIVLVLSLVPAPARSAEVSCGRLGVRGLVAVDPPEVQRRFEGLAAAYLVGQRDREHLAYKAPVNWDELNIPEGLPDGLQDAWSLLRNRRNVLAEVRTAVVSVSVEPAAEATVGPLAGRAVEELVNRWVRDDLGWTVVPRKALLEPDGADIVVEVTLEERTVLYEVVGASTPTCAPHLDFGIGLDLVSPRYGYLTRGGGLYGPPRTSSGPSVDKVPRSQLGLANLSAWRGTFAADREWFLRAVRASLEGKTDQRLAVNGATPDLRVALEALEKELAPFRVPLEGPADIARAVRSGATVDHTLLLARSARFRDATITRAILDRLEAAESKVTASYGWFEPEFVRLAEALGVTADPAALPALVDLGRREGVPATLRHACVRARASCKDPKAWDEARELLLFGERQDYAYDLVRTFGQYPSRSGELGDLLVQALSARIEANDNSSARYVAWMLRRYVRPDHLKPLAVLYKDIRCRPGLTGSPTIVDDLMQILYLLVDRGSSATLEAWLEDELARDPIRPRASLGGLLVVSDPGRLNDDFLIRPGVGSFEELFPYAVAREPALEALHQASSRLSDASKRTQIDRYGILLNDPAAEAAALALVENALQARFDARRSCQAGNQLYEISVQRPDVYTLETTVGFVSHLRTEGMRREWERLLDSAQPVVRGHAALALAAWGVSARPKLVAALEKGGPDLGAVALALRISEGLVPLVNALPAPRG